MNSFHGFEEDDQERYVYFEEEVYMRTFDVCE